MDDDDEGGYSCMVTDRFTQASTSNVAILTTCK